MQLRHRCSIFAFHQALLRQSIPAMPITTILRRHLFTRLCVGRIDFCNSLLFGLPAVHVNKLQRIRNSPARLVCSIPRFDHITPVLYMLHWLPVSFRTEFKILVLTTFKAINGIAPSYIYNLVKTKEQPN